MTTLVAWRRALPAVVGALLVVCAALVIIGVSLERGSESHAEGGAVAGSSEQGESAAERAAEGAAPQPARHAEAGTTVLGVSLESPWALTGLAVVSVALAVLVWRRPRRAVLGVVIVVTVAAGGFDVAEVGRQLSADRAGLAVLAMLIVVLRMVTVAGAAVLWRSSHRDTFLAG